MRTAHIFYACEPLTKEKKRKCTRKEWIRRNREGRGRSSSVELILMVRYTKDIKRGCICIWEASVKGTSVIDTRIQVNL